jgi:SAM-dependent methyltransferase
MSDIRPSPSGPIATPADAQTPHPVCWACGAPAALDETFADEHLYRCPACGLLFAPFRRPEELEALYDDGYFDEYAAGEAYDEDEAQRRYEARLRVALLQRYIARGSVLEIGAASGYFLDEARRAGFEVAGVEPGSQVAARARDKLGLDVQTGIIESARLPERHFDAACAWHVVEHLAEPAQALARLRQVLRPHGHLLVEVPNIESVYAHRWGKRWVNLDLGHHVGHYGRTSLERLLANHGFDVIEMETFPSLGYIRPARAVRPIVLATQAKELLVVRTRPPAPTRGNTSCCAPSRVCPAERGSIP